MSGIKGPETAHVYEHLIYDKLNYRAVKIYALLQLDNNLGEYRLDS